eukprot:TRINITY_DN949_c0_g1_i4.p1 TRINITY_DN949_c0_g1~~TRINITY_DN949_c0_g1_i4.p1  ORF type:complete len:102 (-),score=11.73 TRINITY_DN949_c0_g1_i4:31-336(-)
MIRRPPRSTLSSSSAASDVYKRQVYFWAAVCLARRSLRALMWTAWFILRTRRVFTRRGSQEPRWLLFLYMGRGFLMPFLWAFTDWLWLVWFLDLAIVSVVQ